MQELILMKTCHSLTSLKPDYVINLLKEWQASINSMSKLNYYVKYKIWIWTIPLNIVGNYMIRKWITWFLLGSHRLEIELGRITGIDRESRLCKLCRNRISCIIVLSEIFKHKSKYLHTSWPSVNKFVSSKNVKKIFLNFTKLGIWPCNR